MPSARNNDPWEFDIDITGWAMRLGIGVAILLSVLLLAMYGPAVTDEPTALRILTDDGVAGVVFTGYEAWTCGDGDWYHTGFRGTKNGRPVSGVVCGGINKANTVRYH